MVKKKQKTKEIQKTEEKFIVNDHNDFKNIVDNEVEVFNPEDLFGTDNMQAESAISKELFNPKNPKIKTELSDREISIMSRLYEKSRRYYEPRGIWTLKKVLDEYILLRISKDRKSRAEFVETNRELQRKQGNSFMDKILGRNGGMQGGSL